MKPLPEMTAGTRVTAILDAKNGVVRSLGEGVYAGDFPCPELYGFDNPRIDLDYGKSVWGCECWWGDTAKIEEKFPKDAWTWQIVDIDEFRAPKTPAEA